MLPKEETSQRFWIKLFQLKIKFWIKYNYIPTF